MLCVRAKESFLLFIEADGDWRFNIQRVMQGLLWQMMYSLHNRGAAGFVVFVSGLCVCEGIT